MLHGRLRTEMRQEAEVMCPLDCLIDIGKVFGPIQTDSGPELITGSPLDVKPRVRSGSHGCQRREGKRRSGDVIFIRLSNR